MIRNIEEAFQRVDEIDFREGLVAYQRYRATLIRVAEYYDSSLPRVAAAFCALSPNNDYMGNLRSTVTLLKAIQEGRRLEECTVSTYKACARRAWAFLNGDNFLARTKGKKTRAFFQNIMDPEDPFPVTIDGHMIGLWHGRRMTMVQAVYLRSSYDEIAADFREFAIDVDLIPSQLQSMLWFTWKRIHNVIYRPQMDLLCPEDHWRLDLHPEDIRPFPENGHAARAYTRAHMRPEKGNVFPTNESFFHGTLAR